LGKREKKSQSGRYRAIEALKEVCVEVKRQERVVVVGVQERGKHPRERERERAVQ
jgi:ABC-type branched-subunit amino acid transport system ATPase component